MDSAFENYTFEDLAKMIVLLDEADQKYFMPFMNGKLELPITDVEKWDLRERIKETVLEAKKDTVVYPVKKWLEFHEVFYSYLKRSFSVREIADQFDAEKLEPKYAKLLRALGFEHLAEAAGVAIELRVWEKRLAEIPLTISDEDLRKLPLRLQAKVLADRTADEIFKKAEIVASQPREVVPDQGVQGLTLK